MDRSPRQRLAPGVEGLERRNPADQVRVLGVDAGVDVADANALAAQPELPKLGRPDAFDPPTRRGRARCMAVQGNRRPLEQIRQHPRYAGMSRQLRQPLRADAQGDRARQPRRPIGGRPKLVRVAQRRVLEDLDLCRESLRLMTLEDLSLPP